MLYYVILCYIMLYYVILCYIMLYYVILCYIMLYYVIMLIEEAKRQKKTDLVNCPYWLIFCCSCSLKPAKDRTQRVRATAVEYLMLFHWRLCTRVHYKPGILTTLLISNVSSLVNAVMLEDSPVWISPRQFQRL